MGRPRTLKRPECSISGDTHGISNLQVNQAPHCDPRNVLITSNEAENQNLQPYLSTTKSVVSDQFSGADVMNADRGPALLASPLFKAHLMHIWVITNFVQKWKNQLQQFLPQLREFAPHCCLLWSDFSANSGGVTVSGWVHCEEGNEGFKMVCWSGDFGGRKVAENDSKVDGLLGTKN